MEYTTLIGPIGELTHSANQHAKNGWVVQQVLSTGAMIEYTNAPHEPQFVFLLARSIPSEPKAEGDRPVRRTIGRPIGG